MCRFFTAWVAYTSVKELFQLKKRMNEHWFVKWRNSILTKTLIVYFYEAHLLQCLCYNEGELRSVGKIPCKMGVHQKSGYTKTVCWSVCACMGLNILFSTFFSHLFNLWSTLSCFYHNALKCYKLSKYLTEILIMTKFRCFKPTRSSLHQVLRSCLKYST